MGLFSKLFKGPEVDIEKSNANVKKMRELFNNVVENGDSYQIIFGYTEDVSRFNYGFVHGSKTKIGNLIVGWNEEDNIIVVGALRGMAHAGAKGNEKAIIAAHTIESPQVRIASMIKERSREEIDIERYSYCYINDDGIIDME